jgi:glycosyltransferase involved in cell wall biosynthesis
LRVLQLVQKPQRRGAEIFAAQLSDELRRMGHAVRACYLYPSTADHAIQLTDGDVVIGGSETHPLERLLGVNPAILKAVHRVIDEFQPDVVQANGGRTVKYGALARRRDSSWTLVYRNIGMPEDWIPGVRRKYFYRFLMKRIDGVIGVSSAALASLHGLYRYSVPSTTILNGIDPHAFVPRQSRAEVRVEQGTAPDVPVLIFVGSLTQEKRVDRLLDVHQRVLRTHPRTVLWIVGGGTLRGELEAYAARLGVMDSTRFVGVQSDVASLLHAADLMVLTSDTEGVPAVLLEAGYCGLPVVASDVGGVRECVQHGITGYLVPRDDIEGFSRRILEVLDDPTLRSRVGGAAREHVEAHFLMDAVAAEYVSFYTELRKKSGQGPSGDRDPDHATYPPPAQR